MSNNTTTVHQVQTIRGLDPQSLIENIIRQRIYESLYWKEFCFGLNAESLIDRAVDLNCIGGQFANTKPENFLCLLLKLLQLQPQWDIILTYLKAKDFKYLRILAAFYIRLVGKPKQIYELLEPLLEDYEKLRIRLPNGEYTLTHVDEFVDQLLTEERVCDTILPRIPKRHILEENDEILPRISPLERDLYENNSDIDFGDSSEDEDNEEDED
ncbi:PRP38-domain-containing protein [Conidiobolus coronatus NRRL 28638]|uniref:Pre-mRNA-splicing factor 38 n=1 Tax=Conidiobolus coronatus (strain ATCC 28846 / CBS 209.66 / NRRL 28638) TaxID=796925 RepID=A0A137P1R7_CONC2|nr:PRP38-domain-containing protein [Conidiobolus coronatus NRRL 28638]|eukprot:KXN68898.1 PRP38-domain-containing protein [Conidiobolus coronatus NRRL 28638]